MPNNSLTVALRRNYWHSVHCACPYSTVSVVYCSCQLTGRKTLVSWSIAVNVQNEAETCLIALHSGDRRTYLRPAIVYSVSSVVISLTT